MWTSLVEQETCEEVLQEEQLSEEVMNSKFWRQKASLNKTKQKDACGTTCE